MDKAQAGDVVRLGLARSKAHVQLNVRVGAQVSEGDTQVLRRVAEGSKEEADVNRVRQIQIKDTRHVLWALPFDVSEDIGMSY